MKQRGNLFVRIFAVFLAVAFVFPQGVIAHGELSEEIEGLNDDISTNKAQLDQLNDRLSEYQSIINQKESEAASLENELALIENRIAKTELELEATALEISTVEQEIQLLEAEIHLKTEKLDTQKSLLKRILKEMEEIDQTDPMRIIFTSNTFSEVFDKLSRLERVQDNLQTVLQETKFARTELEDQQSDKELRKEGLEDLEGELEAFSIQLTQESGAKEVLLIETEQSEAQYRELIRELQQEQQALQYAILEAQRRIDEKILDSDAFGDATLLTYPVDDFIVTATYHDPTYPFRHLFEHSGVDFAIPQGTPLKAAAPGYVAFTRTGRSYGNYIMIIHANGIATLYAHLSAFAAGVDADTFVQRGEIIGYSGGLPGTQGAGLSTGPHLHFEVRQNGIPVNPIGYLVSY